MRLAVRFALVFVVVGLAFTGCKKLWADDDLNPAGAATHRVSQPDTFTIKYGSGQNLAGYAIVSLQDSNMIVKIELVPGRWMTASHVDIAINHTLFPKNQSGRLLPGQFRYKTDPHNPIVTSVTYVCPEYRVTANGFTPFGTGWGEGDSWAIAVHVTSSHDTTIPISEWESAWAPEFSSNGNWFYYKVRKVWKDVTLPDENVKMRYVACPWTAEQAYFKVELDSVPGDSGDYAVWDGYWRGWCAEAGVRIVKDVWSEVTLWSSLNPQLPQRLQNDGWDNVNWLLNNKGTQADWVDLQLVIWYLLGEWTKPEDEPAKSLAEQAEEDGEGFLPDVGDWIAVICETPEEVQLLFIEVDP